MKVSYYIEMDYEYVRQNIPYQIITETTSMSIWETGRRRRLYNQMFNETERRSLHEIIKTARRFAFRCIPADGMKASAHTLGLWRRLADFCAML